MSSTRSGYVIEVPLGLWSVVEFIFQTDPDSGDVVHIEAVMVDDGGVYELPPALRDFAAGYMKTWLTTMRRTPDGFEFRPQLWVGHDHWQESTTDRLAALAVQGKATFRGDLDE